MNVLFVYSVLDIPSLARPIPSLQDIHLGMSYVAAAVRAGGHSVELVVLCCTKREESMQRLDEAVARFEPDLIGFTAVSTQFPFICEAATRLRSTRPEAFLLLGGSHASLVPEDAIQGAFDGMCVGEGEYATLELLDRLAAGEKASGIRNLWLKDEHGTVERNPNRGFDQDLDALPGMNREMWLPWVYEKVPLRQVILIGRGCPYLCTYCSNHALRDLAKGQYVRFRPPEDIIEEIEDIVTEFPSTREIYLQVETIAVDRPWLEDLCNQLKEYNEARSERLSFAVNYRINRTFLKDEIFRMMKGAGVDTIEIGLESGSDRIRKKLLKRHYSNEQFLEAVALARKHEMRVHVYNLIGIPEETPDDHMETVRMNQLAQPDRSLTSIFYPYPGTELFDWCKSRGLVTDELDPMERRSAALELPTFSRKEIQRAYDWFDYRIYQDTRPLHFRVRRLVGNKIKSNPILNEGFQRALPYWHGVRRRLGIAS